MIVFDLKCARAAHVFEAWFGCTDTYERQHERRQIICPICGDSEIEKALMVPNVASKTNSRPSHPTTAHAHIDAASLGEAKALLASLAKTQASLIANSKWVGRDFVRHVRAMADGETSSGSVYGEATRSEAIALINDGIDIMSLPLPVVPPDQCN